MIYLIFDGILILAALAVAIRGLYFCVEDLRYFIVTYRQRRKK